MHASLWICASWQPKFFVFVVLLYERLRVIHKINFVVPYVKLQFFILRFFKCLGKWCRYRVPLCSYNVIPFHLHWCPGSYQEVFSVVVWKRTHSIKMDFCIAYTFMDIRIQNPQSGLSDEEFCYIYSQKLIMLRNVAGHYMLSA